uniref:Lysine-specific histone demethylase 1A n=2 Tax=Ascaris suum TaxID=6253 RepID=F1KWG0_ASCSU
MNKALNVLLKDGDNMDILQWEDDDLALEAAAADSRLPFDKLTSQELACFPDVAENNSSLLLYLYIRNKTLQLWHLMPSRELLYETVLSQLPSPYDSDRSLVYRVHAFLQRYGYINFGVFTSEKAPAKPAGRKVIVIGAGAAGLAAARQLQFFGIEVIVVEARWRTGGRISTYRKPTTRCLADLGAMFVMGLVGNPIVTVAKQINMTLSPVDANDCPIFDCDGSRVKKHRDRMTEVVFNEIVSTVAHIAHNEELTEISGQKTTLGEAYETVMIQLEHRHQAKVLKYWEDYRKILEKMKGTRQAMITARKTMEDLEQAIHSAAESLKSASGEREKLVASAEYNILLNELKDAIRRYDIGDKHLRELRSMLGEFSKQEPPPVFMNELDRSLINFHFANLEYGNGTSLFNSSMKDWNQDDDYEFEGPHCMVREGLDTLTTSLSNGLVVELGQVVEQIDYSNNGVRVKCVYGNKEIVHTADACLCTVPLGVLKRSLSGKADAPVFLPSLPAWKQKAIESLGFGNLNKVILTFEKPFWNQLQAFGRAAENSLSRGEFYIFYPVCDMPVLIAMMAGASAFVTESFSDEVILSKAMKILSSIFGQACPREPLDSVITRWHTDAFARGCYSYVSPDSSGDTYDELAMPVCDAQGRLKVFFAGEHTNRNYPSSVHGAFLSGLREAGRIADELIGCPYSPFYCEDEEMSSLLE